MCSHLHFSAKAVSLTEAGNVQVVETAEFTSDENVAENLKLVQWAKQRIWRKLHSSSHICGILIGSFETKPADSRIHAYYDAS